VIFPYLCEYCDLHMAVLFLITIYVTRFIFGLYKVDEMYLLKSLESNFVSRNFSVDIFYHRYTILQSEVLLIFSIYTLMV